MGNDLPRGIDLLPHPTAAFAGNFSTTRPYETASQLSSLIFTFPQLKIRNDGGEIMKYLRKIVLTATALALMSVIYVAESQAQGRSRWYGNNGRHNGWTQGRHRGWDNRRGRGWDNDRRSSWYGGRSRGGYLSWDERRRLQRQRYRLYNTRNRYYRDGYLNDKERRRLSNRYNRYRRNVYRDRRDW